MNQLRNEFKTLVECMEKIDLDKRNGITYIYGENNEKIIEYSSLFNGALKALNILQKRGISKGDKLILQIEKLEDFINVFWACILGGIIPVPITIANTDENRNKLSKINNVLKHAYYISSTINIKRIQEFSKNKSIWELNELVENRSIDLNEIYESSIAGQIYRALPNDIAFIQFSSGSTGDPKGVVLTHENLLTNIYAMINCGKFSEVDAMLSWMPLTHDMGIIGFHLLPLVLNINQCILPTDLFIRRPTLWLKKASEHKTSILGSSNFGYKHFLKTFKDDVNYEWDLSNIRLFFTGAEHISAQLCDEFIDKIKKFGVNRNTIFTVYGLAEASLGVSFPCPGTGIKKVNLSRNCLSIGQRVMEVSDNCGEGIQFVGVGKVIDNCLVRICDEENNVLEEKVLGYVHINGKNVTKGYFNNEEANTNYISKDGWINTDDVGFFSNNSLTIVGRGREIILCNGQSIHPHYIENVVEEIYLGMVVAVGVGNCNLNTQDVILFVRYKKPIETFFELALKLKEHVLKRTMIQIKQVIPIKQIPKTTSGKIQRYKLVEKYLNGEFIDITNCLKIE